MKRILKAIDEYIPEFFMFTPIVIWLTAFITKNPTIENIFLNCWWWMFLGITLAEFDIIYSKIKNFL